MTRKLVLILVVVTRVILSAEDQPLLLSPVTRAKLAAAVDPSTNPRDVKAAAAAWNSLFDRSQILREFIFLYSL